MNNTLKLFSSFAAALLLHACTGVVSPQSSIQDPDDLLFDSYFVGGTRDLPPILQPDLLSLPADYRDELDRIVAGSESEYERYRKMRSWIYRRFQDFEFDVTETYSIGQLNTNRKINCLSFSVMFVAAARYIGVPANFQLVQAPPYWDKEDNNWINNQHINVGGTVSFGDDEFATAFDSTRPGYPLEAGGRLVGGSHSSSNLAEKRRYTADINPAILRNVSGVARIDDQQVYSLFYSNKAIEALLGKDLSLAYAYTKQALISDPNSAIAWNNLGVLYTRAGQPELAAKAYLRAIEFDEQMYSAKSNLASNYRTAGKHLQAALIENDINNFREQNPYYHSALADTSLAEGDLSSAKSHLEHAVEQKHNEHFFYHQLAVVSQRLGDKSGVQENLKRARRYARGAEKSRFAGKLAALEALYAADQ